MISFGIYNVIESFAMKQHAMILVLLIYIFIAV